MLNHKHTHIAHHSAVSVYKGCNNTAAVSYFSKLKVINSVHNNYSVVVAILLRDLARGNNYKQTTVEELED